MSEQTHRRRLRPFTAWIIGSAALCAALLSACGGDSDQTQPQTVIDQQTQQPQQVAGQQEQSVISQAVQQQAQATQIEYDQQVHEQADVEYDEQEQMQAVVEYEQEQAMQQESSEGGSTSQPQASPRNERTRRAVQIGQPGNTTFRDYPTTGWRSTEYDDTSTFSLDVDRTSYFLALNWVQSGYEIEPASIRAEEWINAFDYRYALPDASDSFAVTTDIIPHPIHPDLHLVRVAAQAPEFVDETPLNVTLVLDASGSMAAGGRVEIARAAANAIRGGLREQDRLAIVQFSSDVVDAVDHRHPQEPALADSINRLQPRDSTNVQAGLNRAVMLADGIRRERPDAYNYIILMSDGVANVDATDPFQILAAAGDYDAGNPLRLITVGVGIDNYNDVLLEQLAQYGNGWYRYLSDREQARAAFSRENWLALSIPFADQARAQVRWDEHAVAHWRVIGYENRVTSDQSFQQDRSEFAEIPMGAATTVFFEVELAYFAPIGADLTLGEVELRWLTPQSGRSMSRGSNLQQVRMDSRISRFGDDPMLDLGAIVALIADRYSWHGQQGLASDVSFLAGGKLYCYWNLPSAILDTQAGRDFALLVDEMSNATVMEPESEHPGY